MTDASRRDESTDVLLRRTMSPGREPETTEACLDGEVAAAWLDGRLHGEALERARTHVADCARCQTLMATLVRAEGEAAPVVVGPPKAAVETAPHRPWWMWMVPVAAAAAIVLAVVLLPRTPPQVASAPTTAPTAAPTAPAPEPKQLADAKNAGAATPPAERKAEEAPKIDRKDADAKLGTKKRPAPPARAATAPPKPARGTSANDTKITAAPAAAAPPPAPPPALAREVGRLQQAVQAPPLGKDEIGSPDPMIRWRLRRRAVERSSDGGKTWTAMPTGIDAEWTAGAAPSATAFWLVGRGGMVARTTDGRTFDRVPFPELTDLSSVQATDAQTATILSKDGHTFTTTDGGRSWARKDLQENHTAPFNE